MFEAPASSESSIYPALLTAAAAVFTSLLTQLIGWLQTKSADSRRAKTIEEAVKRVQFLEGWYRTRLAVAPNELEAVRSIVQHELDAAMERIKTLEIPAVTPAWLGERNARIAKLSWFRRWFLLYKPVRLLAWLPRLYFYLSAAFATLYAVGLAVIPLANVDWLRLFVNSSIFLATVFSARWFAVFVDRKPIVQR